MSKYLDLKVTGQVCIELSSASQARKEIQNLNEKCFQLKNEKKSK